MNRRQLLLGSLVAAAAPGVLAASPRLPAFSTAQEAWLNSAPLGAGDIAGRPVLVEFWTFGCSNCRATLPWMKQTYARYAPRGLVVVAVHTPEFSSERELAAVRVAVRQLGVTYPVMLDADGDYWRALGNRYWPAFHLFDRSHVLAATRIGELHAGEKPGDSLEQLIEQLVAA